MNRDLETSIRKLLTTMRWLLIPAALICLLLFGAALVWIGSVAYFIYSALLGGPYG